MTASGAATTPPATPHRPTPQGRPRDPYPFLPVGLNDRAKALIGERIEAGTASKYAGAWRRYTEWCTRQGLPPIRPVREDQAIQLANFIADEQADLALGVSACKTRVAAVSTRLTLTTGWHLGEDPLVSAVMGGIRKRKPEQPRYEDMPNLDVLWRYLDAQPDNDRLDQAHLVGKTAALLLTFGLRKCDQVRVDLAGSIIANDMMRLKTLTKETQGRTWTVQPIPAAPRFPKRCAGSPASLLGPLLRPSSAIETGRHHHRSGWHLVSRR